MSGFRREGMRGTGTVERAPIPVTISVTARHYDPGVTPTGVTISFAPTDRAVVEKAVDAFRKVIVDAS